METLFNFLPSHSNCATGNCLDQWQRMPLICYCISQGSHVCNSFVLWFPCECITQILIHKDLLSKDNMELVWKSKNLFWYVFQQFVCFEQPCFIFHWCGNCFGKSNYTVPIKDISIFHDDNKTRMSLVNMPVMMEISQSIQCSLFYHLTFRIIEIVSCHVQLPDEIYSNHHYPNHSHFCLWHKEMIRTTK